MLETFSQEIKDLIYKLTILNEIEWTTWSNEFNGGWKAQYEGLRLSINLPIDKHPPVLSVDNTKLGEHTALYDLLSERRDCIRLQERMQEHKTNLDKIRSLLSPLQNRL